MQEASRELEALGAHLLAVVAAAARNGVHTAHYHTFLHWGVTDSV